MRVAAVVVDYHADDVLGDCVASLRRNNVSSLVVVNNGATGASDAHVDAETVVVNAEHNLGFGRGVNRGVALSPPSEFLLICNPDLVVHDGAVAAMLATVTAHPHAAIVGPQMITPEGATYPAHRVFPHVLLAGAHAILAPWWPSNPATRRYRAPRKDGTVDWVSGACFLMRRDVFELIGGFDESYFMFAEDMDLCWRAQRAGYDVVTAPSAVVTHIEGVSRARAPWAMTVAHHQSALRFEARTARGPRRLLLPVAAAVLGLRLGTLRTLRLFRR